MPKKRFIWTFAMFGAGLLFIAAAITFLILKLGLFEKTYTKQDLIENLASKQAELAAVKTHVNVIVPAGKAIHIEFEDRRTLSIFHLTDERATTSEAKYDQNWGLKVTDGKTQALLAKLGWTTETLLTLQEKLAAAHCISVESSEPCAIGFQRSGMGMYFYKLFDRQLSESEIKHYNDGCQYLYHGSNIVLEYGGGAIGPQCFPDK